MTATTHRRPPAARRRRGRARVAADPRGAYTAAPADAGPTPGGDPPPRYGASSPDVAAVTTPRSQGVVAEHADLSALTSDQLRSRVAALRRIEGEVAAAMAATIRALSTAGGVAEDGAPSVSAWLRTHTGRSGRDAARLARLSSTLEDLPATARALAAGQVTVESADAVVRAARDGRLGPPDEVDAALAPIAREVSPEQLRSEVRRRTQAADGAAMVDDEARQHQRRRVSLTRRDDGMWDLYGLLTDQTGERVRTLLDVFDTPDDPVTPKELRRRPDQRLADALHTAAGVALDHGDLPADGGQSRPHVSVLVDVTTLDADLADPVLRDRPVGPDDRVWADLPPAETAWGGQLSPQAVRQLCCDAGISRIVTAGPSQVLDVGRATRQWTAPQRRAIHARDRTCRGPGCHRPISWTSIHHIQWWQHDGPTDIDNGLGVCDQCHGLVHHLGWLVELDPVTAAATWTSPDRRRTIVTHPRPPG